MKNDMNLIMEGWRGYQDDVEVQQLINKGENIK